MTKQEAYQLQKFIESRLHALHDEHNIDEFNRVALLESIVNREIANLCYAEQTLATKIRWWFKYVPIKLFWRIFPKAYDKHMANIHLNYGR